MKFEEDFGGLWQQSCLTTGRSCQGAGVCDRTFRQYINRYTIEAKLEMP